MGAAEANSWSRPRCGEDNDAGGQISTVLQGSSKLAQRYEYLYNDIVSTEASATIKLLPQ
eukprot:scaffold556068_cov38-Prasinocladus_malaysianus.AAC.1